MTPAQRLQVDLEVAAVVKSIVRIVEIIAEANAPAPSAPAPASRISVPLPDQIAFSVKDVRKLTGLSQTTIYHMMKTGQLASIKVCGRRMFRREDLGLFFNGAPP